jgi:hypothetical protein
MLTDQLKKVLIPDKHDNHMGDELNDNWGAQL